MSIRSGGRPGGRGVAKTTRTAERPPTATPARSASLAHALDTIERKDVRYKTEHGAILTPDGQVLIEKTGSRQRVAWQMSEVRHYFAGNILTHNHPYDTGFSPADIRTLLDNGLAEMRAVTATARYSMRPPDGGFKMPYSQIAAHVMIETNRVRAENVRDIRAGRLTVDEANRDNWHQIWTAVAARTGLRYERELWNPSSDKG